MSRREGITGTGAIYYPADPDLLRGVLASELETKVYPDGSNADDALIAERCQHGEVVAWHTLRSRQQNESFKCKECAWLYAWKEAK